MVRFYKNMYQCAANVFIKLTIPAVKLYNSIRFSEPQTTGS